MIRYTVTTHPHLAGVGLSRAGSWGNLRYPDDASARDAARKDAAGSPFTVEAVAVRRRLAPAPEA